MPSRYSPVLVLLLICWWMGLLPRTGAAAQTSMEGGPRAAAMGGAGAGLPDDVWGVANPASWSTLNRAHMAVHGTQAFNLPEMRLGALSYVQPSPLGALALGARTFGFEAYRQSRFTAGLARGIGLSEGRTLHVALTLAYFHTSIEGYGAAGAAGLSAGMLVPLHRVLYLGAHAVNLNRPTLGQGEELPRTLSAGLGYRPDPDVHLALDVVKDVRFPLSLRAGLEKTLLEMVQLRAGVATAPVRFTAGVGLLLEFLSVELAAEQHEVLGWSPAAAVGLSW